MERFLSEVGAVGWGGAGVGRGRGEAGARAGRGPHVVTRMLFTSQKGYLIIIIISPKYYETVTASPVLENDERTFNTVYIHKQVCTPPGDQMMQPDPPPPHPPAHPSVRV